MLLMHVLRSKTMKGNYAYHSKKNMINLYLQNKIKIATKIVPFFRDKFNLSLLIQNSLCILNAPPCEGYDVEVINVTT